jgi:DNA-binding LacI/PurR family transcriptional regulator
VEWGRQLGSLRRRNAKFSKSLKEHRILFLRAVFMVSSATIAANADKIWKRPRPSAALCRTNPTAGFSSSDARTCGIFLRFRGRNRLPSGSVSGYDGNLFLEISGRTTAGANVGLRLLSTGGTTP